MVNYLLIMSLTALRGILASLFSLSQLRRFLADHYPSVLDNVSATADLETYAFEVVREFQRRGHVNDRLLDRLIAERPGRKSDIEAVREVHSADTAQNPTVESSASPPPNAVSVLKRAWFADLPLDFSRSDTREAEALLARIYANSDDVVRAAQDAGVEIDQLELRAKHRDLVRQLMQAARAADAMQRMLRSVLDDAQKSGFHEALAATWVGHSL